MIFKSIKNENFQILIGFILINLYYFFKFWQSGFLFDDKFFLSFSYAPDPRYIPQIINALSIFYNDYQISNIILHLPDFFFVKIFGLENLWVTVLIYKIIIFLILVKIPKKIFNLSDKKLFIWIIVVILSLCSSYEIFSDRLIRNQLTIIIYSINLLNLYLISKKNVPSNTNYILVGASTSILLSSDPCSLLFLSPIYIYFYKKFINKIFIFYFILFFLPSLYVLIGQKVYGYSNLDYLGSKIILDNFDFYSDYFIELIKSKRIVLLLIFIFIINIISRNFYRILFILISIFLTPLILLIFDFTIGSYHLLQGAFNFVLFFSYLLILETISKEKFKIMKKEILLSFAVFFLIAYSILIIFINNNWINYSLETKKNYKNYFQKINNFNKACVLISNEDNIRNYARALNIKVLPKEGFNRNNSIDETIKEINFLIYFLKIKDKSVIKSFYWSAAHALFFNTRSTISKKSIKISTNYNEKLKNINNMSGFKINIPNEYLDYSNIIKFVDSNKSEYVKFVGKLKNFVYFDRKINLNSSNCFKE